MKNHLLSRHQDNVLESDKPKEDQRNLHVFMNTKNCPWEWADEIAKRIAEMVATDLRPISIVEGYGFKRLVSYMSVPVERISSSAGNI